MERKWKKYGERRAIEKDRGKFRKERSIGDFGIEERKRENEREGTWVRG